MAAYSARLGRLPDANIQPVISSPPEPDTRELSDGPHPAGARIRARGHPLSRRFG